MSMPPMDRVRKKLRLVNEKVLDLGKSKAGGNMNE